VKKLAALVIELSKTSKVKRRFSALGLSPKEWASTKVLWFSSKLYSLDEINEIHQSKDWNRVSQKDSRQPCNKVRPAHSQLIAREDPNVNKVLIAGDSCLIYSKRIISLFIFKYEVV
jgi:hypothetical protein